MAESESIIPIETLHKLEKIFKSLLVANEPTIQETINTWVNPYGVYFRIVPFSDKSSIEIYKEGIQIQKFANSKNLSVFMISDDPNSDSDILFLARSIKDIDFVLSKVLEKDLVVYDVIST